MTYGLFGTFVAAEGGRDELVRHLLQAAALLDDDPVCLQYIVGARGENDVAVFEVWDDSRRTTRRYGARTYERSSTSPGH